jgi:hypothetical protein
MASLIFVIEDYNQSYADQYELILNMNIAGAYSMTTGN